MADSRSLVFWFALLLPAGPLRAERPLQQVLFDFESGSIPWTTNVWGGPGSVRLSSSSAPKFGAGALRSVLSGVARGGNTLSPWLPADAPWRVCDWGAVSLWFKGDGSPTKAVLRMQTGEGSRVEQDYSFDLPMDSKEWRRFILPVASFWNRGHVAMDTRRLVRCYVGHRGDHSFEVDQLALEAAQRPVSLSRSAHDPGVPLTPEFYQFCDGRYGVRFDATPLLPAPVDVGVKFVFPGLSHTVTETISGDRPGREVLLLAPSSAAGPSSLTIVITRGIETLSNTWRFEAVQNRPLPDPTRLSLLPAPKECRLGDGVFPFTAGMTIEAAGPEALSAARLLAEELGRTWSGLGTVEASRPQGGALRIRLGKGCETAPAARARLPQLAAGGYLLDAGPGGATVLAREAEGLRNGVLTLLQAAESHWALAGGHGIPELHVVDWPNLPFRGVSVTLPNTRWGHPNDPPADPDTFLRFLRETVVRTKMNQIVLIVEQSMRYETHPEVAGPAAWSKQDVKRVFDTLRNWGVEPVPCMNSLGHMNWLCIPRRDLSEDGDVHQICTLHPEAAPVVRNLYQELIDLVQPRVFHAGLDEIRWTTESLPPEKRCPRCAGKSKQDLFVDWVKMLHDFFAEQDIRMMMWGDMILPGHNGGPPYLLAQTVDRLPKDIIIANWSTRLLPDSAQWLRQRGFSEVIKSNSGGATLAEQRLLAGNLFGCWYKVPWLVEATEPVLEGYAYGAFLQAAEYSWNHWTDLFDPLPRLQADFFAARPLVQMRIGSDPVKGGPLQSLPLPQPSQLPGLPEGPVRFGHVSFPVSGAISPEPGKETAIPVGQRARVLYFLQGTRLLDRAAMVDALKRKEHWCGVPVASYEVCYGSGATEVIPVRYPVELRDPEASWCAAPIAYGSMGVFPADAAASGVHLFPMQWINPRPQDPVQSITLRVASAAAARLVLVGVVFSGAEGGTVTQGRPAARYE